MEINTELVKKFFSGKTSKKESEEVRKWLSTEKGSNMLSEIIDEDLLHLDSSDDFIIDHQAPIGRMKKRFMKEIRPFNQKWKNIAVAATIILPFLLLGGTISFLNNRLGIFNKLEYCYIQVPKGERMKIILSDGTSVLLNADSRLKYPKKFGLFSRRVELWGEAYFDVEKDKNKEFSVDLHGLNIKVTGTKFTAKSYPSDSCVQVFLDEGSIILDDSEHLYPLIPGQSASYSRKNGNCIIKEDSNNKDLFLGWKDRTIIFQSIPLSQILKTLERQFDVNFLIKSPEIMDICFTIANDSDNLENILNELEVVSDIRFTKGEDNNIVVYADY